MTKYIVQYLEAVAEKVNRIEENNKKINNSNILLAYRGEPKDYGRTKLMPSLFRSPEYVAREKYLFELLGDYNVIGHEKNRYIEKAIDAQHYVSISRNLDIAFSVLPALYFACKSHENENGVLYVFGFPKHFSPHSKYIEDVYKNILEDGITIYDKNFRVMTHSRYNERIMAQSGGFIFFPGRKHCPINKLYYEEIIIDREHKKYILQELRDFFDVDEAKLFPEKSNDAKTVKSIFEEAKLQDDQNVISVENEINYFFERIDYETEMMRVVESLNAEKFMRILRKEKEDLLFFLSRLEAEEMTNSTAEEWKNISNRYKLYREDIEKRLEILRRSK